MFSLLTDFVVAIFEFIVDVVLFRRQRRKRGHSDRAFSDDAHEIARFDLITLTYIGLASVAVMIFLSFIAGVPLGWSIAVSIAVGVAWGVWQYMRLVDRPTRGSHHHVSRPARCLHDLASRHEGISRGACRSGQGKSARDWAKASAQAWNEFDTKFGAFADEHSTL
ncbi:hypothetical protein M2165_003138 [Variovorax sp. TBS-050B]|uniref:hypothetical protein n=1 Tax=Variovorax sp. TBS-050B TaxID=2940551 RepID=UPI00247317DE|nr:hypothetical protein [Variovorax sp. TBS-050B]MDH6593249.1 hypothetical protein [Variovorax sp. TBS-050B]